MSSVRNQGAGRKSGRARAIASHAAAAALACGLAFGVGAAAHSSMRAPASVAERAVAPEPVLLLEVQWPFTHESLAMGVERRLEVGRAFAAAQIAALKARSRGMASPPTS